MKDKTLLAIINLCACSRKAREASNNLWWSMHPGDNLMIGDAPTVERAEQDHHNAIIQLQDAELVAIRATVLENNHRSNKP